MGITHDGICIINRPAFPREDNASKQGDVYATVTIPVWRSIRRTCHSQEEVNHLSKGPLQWVNGEKNRSLEYAWWKQ